jgi:small-conductance mechanosensitive channel
MNFHVGDAVKVGTRVGTVTDVGTVLIQVKTAEGGLRVVCPWELVKILG